MKYTLFLLLTHFLCSCILLAMAGILHLVLPAEPNVINQSSLRDDTQLGLSRLYEETVIKPFLDDPERIQTDRRGELERFFQEEFEKNKSEKNLHAAIVKKAALYLATTHFLLHELIPLALDDVSLSIYPESPYATNIKSINEKISPPRDTDYPALYLVRACGKQSRTYLSEYLASNKKSLGNRLQAAALLRELDAETALPLFQNLMEQKDTAPTLRFGLQALLKHPFPPLDPIWGLIERGRLDKAQERLERMN